MVSNANLAGTSTLPGSEASSPDYGISPCIVACPLHTDVQGYVSYIAQGRYSDALNLIRETNPLASVLARVCAHPCEDKCRRAHVDGSISVCGLKRVAVERGRAGLKSPEPAAKLDKKVAIIGGGPSGLTAAYDLALRGYQVTVFEKNEKLGGALRYGIPVYRLPREELDNDLQEFEKVGVKFQTGVNVGKDVTVDSLKSEYDAVLIAVGLALSRGLPIPGADLPDVYMALPFLADAAVGKCSFGSGHTVMVIGGGNVAFDVARSALRLGAKKVKMACLERRHEMPAWPHEIAEAEEEGIELNPGWGPKAIVNSGGKITGFELVKVKAVFDETGRFNPTYYDDETKTIEGDIVIFAIGQGSDLSLAKETAIELTPRGLLVFDNNTMATTAPGVFASGEVVTGPGAAVGAMSNGRRAAQAIHSYLSTGKVAPLPPDPYVAVGDLEADTVGKIRKQDRTAMPMVSPEERIKNFDQIELGFNEEAAIREAQRCLLCAVGARRQVLSCPDCLTCVRVCPFDAPIATEHGVEIRLDQCQSCGICATRCPGGYINLKHFSREEIRDRVRASLADAKTTSDEAVLFGFICRYYSGANGSNGQLPAKLKAEGIRVVELPCTGRVDISHILAAFEMGADGVFVTGCEDDDCHFLEGTTYSKGVVTRAKGLLEGTGIGANRLEMVMLSSHEPDELLAKAKEVRERLLPVGASPLRKRV